ncbi:unnamed protein product [Mucor hiemalis]
MTTATAPSQHYSYAPMTAAPATAHSYAPMTTVHQATAHNNYAPMTIAPPITSYVPVTAASTSAATTTSATHSGVPTTASLATRNPPTAAPRCVVAATTTAAVAAANTSSHVVSSGDVEMEEATATHIAQLAQQLIPLPPNEPQFIQLGHAASLQPRTGHVLINSLYYNRVIIKKFKFEVFDLFTARHRAGITCLIGLDLMSYLQIGFTGLIVSHFDTSIFNPFPATAIDPSLL